MRAKGIKKCAILKVKQSNNDYANLSFRCYAVLQGPFLVKIIPRMSRILRFCLKIAKLHIFGQMFGIKSLHLGTLTDWGWVSRRQPHACPNQIPLSIFPQLCLHASCMSHCCEWQLFTLSVVNCYILQNVGEHPQSPSSNILNLGNGVWLKLIKTNKNNWEANYFISLYSLYYYIHMYMMISFSFPIVSNYCN